MVYEAQQDDHQRWNVPMGATVEFTGQAGQVVARIRYDEVIDYLQNYKPPEPPPSMESEPTWVQFNIQQVSDKELVRELWRRMGHPQ